MESTRGQPPSSPRRSSPVRRAHVAALALLAVSAMTVGLWAQFAPESFYIDFPGVRRFWVSLDGPYNEHLIRDVGGLHLSLAALTAAAAVRGSASSGRLVSAGWLVYSLPHLGYHVAHLAPFEPLDAAAQVSALSLQVVIPVWILVTARAPRGSHLPRTRHGQER